MIFHNLNRITMNWLRMFIGMALLGMLFACTNVLFYPQRAQFSAPDRFGVIYEDVEIETSDHIKLHGWKLFASNEVRGTVLFLHGNAENISSHFLNVHWLTVYGYDVYLFDYRGYGKSEGITQLDDVINDADSMISYTIKQLPEDEKLIVMGHSLGASLAIHAVAHNQHKQRIKTLVTVEAFSDYRQITQDVLSTHWLTWLFQWPLSFAVDNSYSPLDSVAQISPIPLLLIHSKEDEVIPYEHAQTLYELAEEPRRLQWVSGRHNYIFNKVDNREILLKYLSTVD